MDNKKTDPFNIKGFTDPMNGVLGLFDQMTKAASQSLESMKTMTEYNGKPVTEDERKKVMEEISKANVEGKLNEMKSQLNSLRETITGKQ